MSRQEAKTRKKGTPLTAEEKAIFYRRLMSFSVFLIIFPLTVLVAALLLRGRHHLIISVLLAALSCLPFFIRFEKGGKSSSEIAIISVMSALSVAGRMLFAPIPGFKPVSAVTVLCGIAFGPEAGFICGSMSAIVSNMFFGQGPWTPFQMLIWGLIGFISGIAFKRGKTPSKIALALFALFSGALYSLGMDIWTSISAEGSFSLNRFLFYAAASLPETLKYMISNLIFLLILCRPILIKTDRIRKKFGVFRGV